MSVSRCADSDLFSEKRRELESPLRHLAIIMDGNGRWAEAQHLPRTKGHAAGVTALRRVCQLCVERSIPVLSVFAFSTENWNRPAGEVSGIFGLVSVFAERYAKELAQNGVATQIVGDRSILPESVKEACVRLEKQQPMFQRMKLVIALNYGGRAEIARMAHRLIQQYRNNPERSLPDQLSDVEIRGALDCPELPDPDLVIRTGGEMRISNFWLWQCAYSELYSTPCLWPDFGADELDKALESYSHRQRRYGAINPICEGGDLKK